MPRCPDQLSRRRQNHGDPPPCSYGLGDGRAWGRLWLEPAGASPVTRGGGSGWR
ncbi:hypothetical protein P7K49_013257, partial [Saguinus oedipus]